MGQGLTLEVQQAKKNLNETKVSHQNRWSLAVSKSDIRTNVVITIKICRFC